MSVNNSQFVYGAPTYRKVKRSIFIKPITAMVIPFFLLICAFFFPPQLYYAIVQEPDYIFLDVPAVVFIATCVSAFYLGYSTTKKLFLSTRLTVGTKINLANFWYLFFPVFVASSLTLFYFVELSQRIDIFSLIFSPDGGQSIKNALLNQHVPLQGTNQFAMGVLWWGWAAHYSSRKNSTFILLVFFSSLFCILMFLQADRALMVSFLVGLSIIVLKAGTSTVSKIEFFKLSLKYSFFALIIVLMTVGFSYFRGSKSDSSLILTFLGYGPASYNRLAAILDGRLVYGSSNSLYFLFQIPHIPFTDDGLLKALGYPNGFDEYQDEFRSVGLAGLNLTYQWATLFGYVLSAVGVFASVIYFYIYGCFAGLFYKLFCDNDPMGVIFYPLVFVSIALWFAFNSFFFWFLLLAMSFIFVSAYQAIFKCS